MDYKEVTLDTLNMGAARELFEEAWRRLLSNIGDPNTKATAARTISIQVRVKPNEKRDSAVTTVAVKESLAPLNPHEHFVVFSTNGNEVQAFTADPKQPELATEGGENITEFRAASGGGK